MGKTVRALKLCSLLALSLTTITATQAAGKLETRTLNFPKEAVGTIFLVPRNQQVGELAIGRSVTIGAAQGTRIVKMIPDSVLMLQINQKVLSDNKIIDQLSVRGVDSLKLNFTATTESDELVCDKALKRLRNCPGMQEIIALDLDQSDVTDAGIRAVLPLAKLKTLSLIDTDVHGECFRDLAATGLTNLCFERAKTTVKHYEELSKLPNLSILSVRWSQIGLPEVKALIKCKKLIDLNISRNIKVDDACMREACKLTKLTGLSISESSITDAGMPALVNCPEIIDLNLQETKVTDASLVYIAKLKKLRRLNVYNTRITSGGLVKLAGLPLEKIILPSGLVTQNQLNLLRQRFPKTWLAVPKREQKDIDIDAICAPQH